MILRILVLLKSTLYTNLHKKAIIIIYVQFETCNETYR